MSVKIVVKTPARKRFENRGFGIKAYATAYNVSHATLSRVLDGTLDGSKSSKDGKVRVLMNQLKKDGVIRGKLSWEK